jgi:hypothetical protein
MTRIQAMIIGIASFAAGVIIGMLVAPKSGKELRKELSESAAKLPHLYDDLKLPRLSPSEVERDLIK